MQMFEVGDGVTVKDYGSGYRSYTIVLSDAPFIKSNNKITVQFDETRKLTIFGDTVSLVESDIIRLRNFLDAYTTLPDERR